jgi:hypothetical protein
MRGFWLDKGSATFWDRSLYFENLEVLTFEKRQLFEFNLDSRVGLQIFGDPLYRLSLNGFITLVIRLYDLRKFLTSGTYDVRRGFFR